MEKYRTAIMHTVENFKSFIKIESLDKFDLYKELEAKINAITLVAFFDREITAEQNDILDHEAAAIMQKYFNEVYA